MLQVWRGEKSDEYGEAAIVSTAALALRTIDKDISQHDALTKAQEAWNKRAKKRF